MAHHGPGGDGMDGQVGLAKAIKICQCREVVITTTKDLPMQADGEPWGQPKGEIKISVKKDAVCSINDSKGMERAGAVD